MFRFDDLGLPIGTPLRGDHSKYLKTNDLGAPFRGAFKHPKA